MEEGEGRGEVWGRKEGGERKEERKRWRDREEKETKRKKGGGMEERRGGGERERACRLNSRDLFICNMAEEYIHPIIKNT